MTPYLQFQGIGKRFGRVTALDGLNLAVEPGAMLALLGPNGAGKSTLFGCLLGFSRPTTGVIRYRGETLEDRHRARFGYVSERVALYPNRTALENIGFIAELKGCPREEVHRQLSRVRLAAVANRKVRQLSKGMLQRLGLAVALLGQPELLVLDEPFNGLDPVVLDEFTAIIRQEQARGATAIISTHTISAIQSLASHVAILLGGKLALHASLAELRREGGSDSCLASLYQSVARRASRQAREVMVA